MILNRFTNHKLSDLKKDEMHFAFHLFLLTKTQKGNILHIKGNILPKKGGIAVKKIVRIGLIVIAVVMILFVSMFIAMSAKTTKALEAQVNHTIRLDEIEDGIYYGESGGGLIWVKVAVTVTNHQITNIELLEHKNGKGTPAEAILNDMIQNNTYDVDVVSGATASSKTIMNAVNQALYHGMQEGEGR